MSIRKIWRRRFTFRRKGHGKGRGKSVNRIEEWRFADETEDPAQICRAFSETPPNIYGFGHTPLYRDVIAAVRKTVRRFAMHGRVGAL